jgi:PEP-CTERM motif
LPRRGLHAHNDRSNQEGHVMKLLFAPGLVPVLACVLVLSSHTVAEAAARHFTFETGSEGWLVTDITSLPGAGVAPTWDDINQRISTSDIASWTTFSAPAEVLGDQSVYYGGIFGFDLQDTLKDANADTVATFGMAAGSTTMYWFGGAPSTTGLSTFVAGLSPDDTRWRIGGLPFDINSGSLPTPAQFQAVLGGLTMLRINADWRTAGNDISTLDNVLFLSPVPEPAPVALLAAGLAALAWRRRRSA